MDRSQTLRKILTQDLPLESVGPGLRRTVRQAVGSGQESLLLAAAGAVVRELVRQDILVRARLEGEDSSSQVFFASRRDGKMLDLSPLYQRRREASSSASEFATPDAVEAHSLVEVDGVLGAMEEAQDLRLGDIQTGDVAAILGNILQLLRGFTPQLRLGMVLNRDLAAEQTVPGIVSAAQSQGQASWLELRDPGHSVWIPQANELPPGMAAVVRENPLLGGDFVAVAIPIREPSEEHSEEEDLEAGLLFVMASESWGRDTLLKVGGRLARFVSNRWRHQRDVNLIIHTDALTGVNNRAFFDKHFTIELERARRTERPLTLVIGDIDLFKKINDKYGHQAGDRILQYVARRLKEELRRIDQVCRIGGEEFALILPDTSPEAGREVMTRLLNADLHEEVLVDGLKTDVPITLSFGGISFPTDGSDAFELFRKADAMLYMSKDAGRHQCHFWDNSGDHFRMAPDSAGDS